MIPGRTLLRLVAVLLQVTFTAACGTAVVEPGPGRIPVGVLGATCDGARAQRLAAAGVTVAVLDVPWSRYEPSDGQVDQAFLADVRRRIDACRAAGLDVELGPGLQYPPPWVLQLRAGQYRDQAGAVPSPPVANLAFSAAVRDAAGRYLTLLARDLPLSRVRAIRVGTTHTAEIGYPAPDAGGGTSSFWAFDAAAQQGSGLAPGMTVSPLPGWRPGQADRNGRPVTSAQVATWFAWYRGALVGALEWQMTTLRGLGYRGELHVPVPGRGVLPAQLAAALTAHLDTSGVPDGSLQRGLDYPAQFHDLAEFDRRDRAAGGKGLVVDFTGFDDASAVVARRLDPSLDRCAPQDVDAVLTGSGDVGRWANQRWTTAVARAAGLPLVGENPGPPEAAHTGGTADSDPIAAQLAAAPAAAARCGAALFLWAFEDTLFTTGSAVTPEGLGGKAVPA